MPTTHPLSPDTAESVALLAYAMAAQTPVDLEYIFDEHGEKTDRVYVISMHPLHAVVQSLNPPEHAVVVRTDAYYSAIPGVTLVEDL